MGTLFEPFIIAFWGFIIALVGFLLWGLISAIVHSLKDDDKKDKED